MRRDKLTTFMKSGSISGNSNNALFGDVVNLQDPRDLGDGETLYVHFVFETAMSGGTSVKFDVRVAENAALTTNDVTVATTEAIPRARAVKGHVATVVIPPGYDWADNDFLGVWRTNSGNVSGGNVTAFLSNQPYTSGTVYPDATN